MVNESYSMLWHMSVSNCAHVNVVLERERQLASKWELKNAVMFTGKVVLHCKIISFSYKFWCCPSPLTNEPAQESMVLTYHTGDQRRLRRAWVAVRTHEIWKKTKGPTKNQTSSPNGWLRIRVWKMSLRRTKSAIISWAGSNIILVPQNQCWNTLKTDFL